MSLVALQRDFMVWLTTESLPAQEHIGGAADAGLRAYLNNYRGALLGCLSASFPVTRAWLGEAAFLSAAARHIDETPPSSWTLDHYAYGLPGTLARLYPDDAEIDDLARLEAALSHAVTCGGDASVTTADFARIDWEQVGIAFSTSLVLVRVTTNVADIWSSIMAEKTPPAVTVSENGGELVLWRRGFAPRFRAIAPNEAAAIRTLQGGATFGMLCEQLVEHHGEEQGTALAGNWLGGWLRDGLVKEISAITIAIIPA